MAENVRGSRKGKRRMNIGFGILYDDINEQLERQGYTIDNPEWYEKRRTDINTLMFCGLLTDAETEKAFKRLFKMIEKYAKKVSK